MSERVPEGWTEGVLGEFLSHIEGGGTPSRTNPNYWGGNILWATVKDLKGHRLSSTEETITEEGLKNSASRIITNGTIIIATRMAVGKSAIFSRNVSINQDLKALYPAENTISEYLLQWLRWQEGGIASLGTGSTVNGIRLETIRALPACFPPLSEQQKIASILTSVDEVIEKTQSQINKLQDLKKATMNELLTKGIGHTEFKDSELGRIPKGWEVKKVHEFITQSKEKNKKELPVYSVLMTGGIVKRSSVDRRVESALDDTDNLYVMSGWFTYNMMRMWQGASGIAPVDCLVSPAYVVCKPENFIDSDFLGYLMKTDISILKLHSHSQGITGDRLRLYFEHFAQIKFSIPPLEEQKKIALILISMDRNIDVKKRKLEQIKSLKKSLMNDLLTGKVRVQVN